MLSKLDLNTIRIFVTVVDKGSFVNAARALSLPTSNISRYVSQLEKVLNVRLLERSTRHMAMTASGKLLYQQAKPMIERLEQTAAELSFQQAHLSGSLNICLPSEGGPYLLANAIADFVKQYPDISLSCRTSLAGIQTLYEEVDVTVIVNRGPLSDSALIARHLVSFPSLVVASPELISKVGLPTHTKQLALMPCISTVTTLQGQPWQFIAKKGQISKVMIKSHYRVNSGYMAKSAAIAGIGFAILPRYFCQQEIDEGKLVAVDLDMPPAPLELFAVYADKDFIANKIRLFIEHIQCSLQKLV